MKTARFVVGALVTGSLVTCPPAHADFDFECKPDGHTCEGWLLLPNFVGSE